MILPEGVCLPVYFVIFLYSVCGISCSLYCALLEAIAESPGLRRWVVPEPQRCGALFESWEKAGEFVF